MSSASAKRVVVLISGRGSNMNTLIAATMDPSYPARICGVISNRADAAGLKVAADHNIPTKTVSHRDFDSREAHDAAIDAALREMNAEIVCLAGYMRLMEDKIVADWSGRMINIHPALLPSFKGVDTHARALSAGVRIHGCSVHFVTQDMDDGPIICQAAVPVLTGDTEETLGARVLKAEHRIYPEALRMVADGHVRMSSGRAVFREPTTREDGMLISPEPRSRS
jgi:formyltetrahydrofolate-dependent phosphoribosylglycinamide formyltransferase